MIIRAIIHRAEEGGFWAEVPALPGCNTHGETEEEIRTNLQEAIELWFEAGDEISCQGQDDQIMELAVRNRFPERICAVPPKEKDGLLHGSRGAITSSQKQVAENELLFQFMGMTL